MEYFCNGCDSPCKLIVDDDADIPMTCPYSYEETMVSWHAVGREETEKTATLPDWCKEGAFVWDQLLGYGRVESVRTDRSACFVSFFDRGCGDYTVAAFSLLCQAVGRELTQEEMKSLVGKILVNKETKDINLVTDYINEVDEDDPGYHYCTVYVGGENQLASELWDEFYLDGKPVGIWKHKNENGEWVK